MSTLPRNESGDTLDGVYAKQEWDESTVGRTSVRNVRSVDLENSRGGGEAGGGSNGEEGEENVLHGSDFAERSGSRTADSWGETGLGRDTYNYRTVL